MSNSVRKLVAAGRPEVGEPATDGGRKAQYKLTRAVGSDISQPRVKAEQVRFTPLKLTTSLGSNASQLFLSIPEMGMTTREWPMMTRRKKPSPRLNAKCCSSILNQLVCKLKKLMLSESLNRLEN